MTELSEQQLAHLLAPLAAIEPARRRPATMPPRRRGHTLAFALVAFAAVAAGAGYGYQQLRYESISPTAPGQPLACADVIGATASSAERYLTKRGYRVEWRLTDYEPAPDGLAAAGYAHAPERVPGASIVEDLASGAESSTVIVFVRAASDPDAPPIEQRTCARDGR